MKIYWAANLIPGQDQNRDFFYLAPNSLYSDIKDHRLNIEASSSFLSCPAFYEKFKKTFVFKSPMKSSYKFDGENIENISVPFLPIGLVHKQSIEYGPIFNLDLSYIFFSEEPVNAYFTPPMFHPPKYTKYVSPMPGEFNIGRWFRPYNIALQCWSNSGEIHIEKDEPLFYVEIKTEDNVELKQFEMTEKLVRYANSSISTTDMFGKGQTLLSRYKRFDDINLRSRILKEIKNNLID